jgi:hypothetical protein
LKLSDAAHPRGTLSERRGGPRPRALRAIRTIDRVAQIVVGDRRILLERLTGRRIDNCVHAGHFFLLFS